MDFLDKLKEKPKPKTKKPIKVSVPVKLSTTIVDKRTDKIDRSKLLKNIKPRVHTREQVKVELESQRPPSPKQDSGPKLTIKKPKSKPCDRS